MLAAFDLSCLPLGQVLRLADENDTRSLAQSLAACLRVGQVIALDGQLGAGKTTFVRHLAQALGGDAGLVASPTYTLLNAYEAQPQLLHVDAYRLQDVHDLDGLGFFELLDESVACVEWASRLPDFAEHCELLCHLHWSHAEQGQRLVRVSC